MLSSSVIVKRVDTSTHYRIVVSVTGNHEAWEGQAEVRKHLVKPAQLSNWVCHQTASLLGDWGYAAASASTSLTSGDSGGPK